MGTSAEHVTAIVNGAVVLVGASGAIHGHNVVTNAGNAIASHERWPATGVFVQVIFADGVVASDIVVDTLADAVTSGVPSIAGMATSTEHAPTIAPGVVVLAGVLGVTHGQPTDVPVVTVDTKLSVV